LKSLLERSWRHPFGPRLCNITDFYHYALIHPLQNFCTSLSGAPQKCFKSGSALANAGPHHIYTNDVKSSIVSGIIIDDLSDHLPIFTISKKISPQKVYSKRKARKINGINAEHFIADLQSRLNSKLNSDQLTSVNLQLELLHETFHAILEDHAPLINPS